MAGGRDEYDLAVLLDQVTLSSVSNLDLASKLQLAETIQASPESSDAAYALALQAADLARTELDRRHAQAYQASSAASVRVAAHDAVFARQLAAVPEDRWAHDGDYFERPLDSSPPNPLFSVLFKGMANKDVVGPHDRDPGVAVLAAAVCDPQGEVVLRIQKPVDALVGGRMMLEAMALMEGLHAALELGIHSIEVVTDYRPLYNHVHGIWYATQKKVADMVGQVVSMLEEFEQCEIWLVRTSEVGYVLKLARDSIDAQIAKALTSKDKRETCTICLEDTDVSKIHAVEGCAHRFCFSCMKEHVRVKLLHGMLPACPQDGCTTKLSVEGSKIFLSSQLLQIMTERIREGQIPPTQKIYCPYPKCSALMSLSELIHPARQSSKHTIAYSGYLRECVKCRGSFCIRCKVPWHDRMSCYNYKRRYTSRPEDVKLQNLAQQKRWRQCVKCKHMIELSEGCYHMTCMCSYEFCYTCGKEWKEKKATCSCPLFGYDDDSEDDYCGAEEDDYYDEDYDNFYGEDYDDYYGEDVDDDGRHLGPARLFEMEGPVHHNNY